MAVNASDFVAFTGLLTVAVCAYVVAGIPGAVGAFLAAVVIVPIIWSIEARRTRAASSPRR